jgi:hypothetical protein
MDRPLLSGDGSIWAGWRVSSRSAVFQGPDRATLLFWPSILALKELQLSGPLHASRSLSKEQLLEAEARLNNITEFSS